MPGPVGKAHLREQVPRPGFQLGKDRLFVLLVVGALFRQQLPGQHHVLQRVYCGKRLKFWKTRPKCSRFLRISSSLWVRGVGGVPQGLAVHRDLPAVGGFQEIQAAQQRCFAGTGRADDRQRFALVQLQGDVAQHGGRAKALADAVYFQ